jgi:hypothetical protein
MAIDPAPSSCRAHEGRCLDPSANRFEPAFADEELATCSVATPVVG